MVFRIFFPRIFRDKNKLGNNRFLLHPFQLIIRYHPAIRVNILPCRIHNYLKLIIFLVLSVCMLNIFIVKFLTPYFYASELCSWYSDVLCILFITLYVCGRLKSWLLICAAIATRVSVCTFAVRYPFLTNKHLYVIHTVLIVRYWLRLKKQLSIKQLI